MSEQWVLEFHRISWFEMGLGVGKDSRGSSLVLRAPFTVSLTVSVTVILGTSEQEMLLCPVSSTTYLTFRSGSQSIGA